MRLAENLALAYARRMALPPGRYDVYVHPHALTLAKAGYGPCTPPNHRWITLHPSDDPDHYVRVCIRVHEDGTAHVVSGGEGLRGLRLTRLRSPEEWKKAAEERRRQREEKRRQEEERKKQEEEEALRRASEDPEFAREYARKKLEEKEWQQEKREKLAEVQARLAQIRYQQAQLAMELGLEGWDLEELGIERPEDLDPKRIKQRLMREVDPDGEIKDPGLKGGAGMVAARMVRTLTNRLKAVERQLIRELAHDQELRAQVLGEEAAIAPEEALETAPEGGLGFRKSLRREAEAKGAKRAEIKREKERIAQERIAALMELDPEKGEAALRGRMLLKDMHRWARALGGKVDAETRVDPKEVKKQAELVKEFLRMAEEAKALEVSMRRFARDTENAASAIQNRDPAAFAVEVEPLEDEEFLARLREDVAETARMELTKSFFDLIERDIEGLPYAEKKKMMMGDLLHGAYAHLNAVMATTLGVSTLDRYIVDVLGIEGAAQVAAHALRKNLSPEELQAVREALKKYHETEALRAMQDALERAEAAMAAAEAIELPEIRDAASLALAKELNELRKQHLEEALEALGTALGQVEMGAALNMALRGKGQKTVEIDFGSAETEAVLTGLRALGLTPEDYRAWRDPETNVMRVELQASALDKLAPDASPHELALRARLEAIRRGELDEPNWLPKGFVSYPTNIHNDPERPKPFAVPPGFAEGRDPVEALREYVASRLADGWKPSDILREVGSVDFVTRYVPESQWDEYSKALDELFPATREDGTLIDVDKDPELQARYETMAREYASRFGDADFHSQAVDSDHPDTRKALYLALMEDPRLQVAFKPLGELSHEDQRALREYFYTEIAKVDPKTGRDTKALKEALEALGPEPQKYGEDLFGNRSITPKWEEWNRKREEIFAQYFGPTAWEEFVAGTRGLDRAYEAIQEHMRGRLVERFHKAYANLTGKPLRLGKVPLTHSERFRAAVDPKERARLLAEEQARMAALRERVQGRFAAEGEGAVKEKLRRSLQLQEALEQKQMALFGGEPGQGYSLELRLEDPFRERYSLGRRLEGQLASILPYVANLPPTARKVTPIPGVNLGAGTRFVRQQRAIKFAKAARKSLMALGMGSGKTLIQIGTFTELNAEGKARKGLFIVPSVVRNQFAEEMARFTEPGRYRFHAKDAPFHERLQAYRDPTTHMVVVTHQTFRDDMLRLMAAHTGLPLEEFQEHFKGLPEESRRRLLRETLQANGMDHLLDYVAIDEGHQALGREGKPDAFLQLVTDAALAEARHAIAATGTPVKNDASEVYDWLKKLDPERWGGERGKEEFKRRYGVNLRAAQEAFKREAARYIYAASIPSGANRKDVWGMGTEQGHIPLTEWQRRELARVHEAYERARAAAREGRVDLEALKVLSPRPFEGVPPEQHEEVGRRLSASLGTLKFAAQARVIDAAPPEHNAKLQHLLRLAREREGLPGVVFAHSLDAVRTIAEALGKEGFRVEVITGADSSEAKAEKRNRFQNGDVDIIVASDAGAVGMNLQRGRWLVNYDLPMTHATHAQRNARIDRIGQTNPVEIHHLVTDSKYDMDAVRRLERKRLSHEIFEGDWERMDDSGLAKLIALERAKRGELAVAAA
ncbi:helicase-related protein [Thermus scotoductus]|uniref:Helicase n=1 Tax=Thermus scotoductus TaxID=37636 RepID=A0A430UQX8_THESC|nr:helicase-related protein [Thermus scotoductus]RTI10513.1 hypothetical protein CSW27_14245 [Thermus scotoductus]